MTSLCDEFTGSQQGSRGRQTVQNINEKHAPFPFYASAIEVLKLLIRYNETAFPIDYKGENGKQ